MEVDPEVAALLDDLPAPALPEALLKEGWGRFTMNQMISYGQPAPASPSEVQQPIYDEHCMECGRPVTMSRGNWTDHSGGSRCDGLLTDNPLHGHHITAGELKVFTAKTKPKKFKDLKHKAACSATRHHHSCAHQCDHEEGHFGFHECKHCKHLWH
jgi:hypothetical protein